MGVTHSMRQIKCFIDHFLNYENVKKKNILKYSIIYDRLKVDWHINTEGSID